MYMNPNKNLIEPKPYMNPTKNLIEPKLINVYVGFPNFQIRRDKCVCGGMNC